MIGVDLYKNASSFTGWRFARKLSGFVIALQESCWKLLQERNFFFRLSHGAKRPTRTPEIR